MKRLCGLALALLLVASPAYADIDEAFVAYKHGDYATALREFLPDAEQGDIGAQFYLGLTYRLGQGVPKDYVLANMWLNLAAAQGDRDSAELRDRIAKLMTPEQTAEAERLAREWKPTN